MLSTRDSHHLAVVATLLAGVALAVLPQAQATAASGKWAVVASPSPGTSLLDGVACATAESCVAVGAYWDANGADHTLVETEKKKAWSVIPSPSPSTTANILEGVSCVTAASCVAVGGYNTGTGAFNTLIETWDGATWTATASPNVSNDSNFLNGVSCTSTTSCVAVGYSSDSTGNIQTLVETWDGTNWTIAASPNPGSHVNFLNGVSCTSTTSCVAVGDYGAGTNGPPYNALIETWDGTTWTVTASPDPSSADNRLNGVSCTTAASCVAVGSYDAGSGSTNTLIEMWHGTTWTITASPDPSGSNFLYGASCVTAASCVAVGQYNSASGILQTLIETWDGATWTIAASPDPSSGQNTLNGVSCASTTPCVAVGYAASATGADQTLVLKQNR
jgi:hypothetical protein